MNRTRNKNGTFKSLHGGDQERVLKCMYAIFQEKGKKLGSTSKEIHAMYEKWFGKKPKSTISSILNVLEYEKKLIENTILKLIFTHQVHIKTVLKKLENTIGTGVAKK